MTSGQQFSLIVLQVCATVALSMAAVEGIDYLMKTPVEPSTYTVTPIRPGRVGPALVSETLQRGGMTPFVENNTIPLDKNLIAALKATPLRQVSVQPIGTSIFSFIMVFNGKPSESVYSTIQARESMYYLDISGATPRLWISHMASTTWKPETIAYVINKDLARFANPAVRK